ncbi:hypothetical protein [Gallibacterium anatis]|uniref:hypothetical protein n=1 Tax=Gallibacterium anatis TaxID=750 RepID=UPI001B33999F|nr:hypothetical protein [Gallibacterium anatis]MBP4133552.1 hypothetical protein [Gallibacterium anatis]
MSYLAFERSEIARITQLFLADIPPNSWDSVYIHLRQLGLAAYIEWEDENDDLIEQFATAPFKQAQQDTKFSPHYWLLLHAKWRFLLHGVWCYHQFQQFALPKHSDELQNYLDSRVQLYDMNAFFASVPYWHPLLGKISPFQLENGEPFWGFAGYPA